MTKYPNRNSLSEAFDIYRDAMRSFIISRLRQIRGKQVEDIVIDSLESANLERANEIERILHQSNRSIESAIDINDFPHLVRKNWEEVFKIPLNDDKTFRNQLWLIKECRNADWAHPPKGDAEFEDTRAYLFFIADVLSKINKQDAKHEVESIRDQLCADKAEEHAVGVSEQIEAENTELKKQLNTTSSRLEEVEAEWIACDNRLTTMSTRLKIAVAGKTVAEERLSDVSNQLELEKTELEKRLKTMSDRLKNVEKENAAYKKRIETIPEQLEAANAEKVKYEKALKAALNQLVTLKSANAKLEERLETTSIQAEAEETEYKEDFAEREGHLPPNATSPDSITFQGTTFTRHLNKYHVTEDDISQNFWHYWHSQGREGKQEMRDAGWSVEKVNGDWEVTISAENFQAWIEDEVSELSNLINPSQSAEPLTRSIQPSYEKISLPTGKEMVQPALRVLADGREHRRVEIINVLTKHFSLTKNQREQLSRSGKAEVYLRTNGLIERTKTGYYRITDLGLEVLRRNPR